MKRTLHATLQSMNIFITIGSMLFTLLTLDALWLGLVMKNFYQVHIGHLMSGHVEWIPAILFYTFFTIGVWYFAVAPQTEAGLLRVVIRCAFFGALAYATYDLTNQATLRDWPLIVTISDIAWGIVVTSASGAVGHVVSKMFI